MTTPRWIMPTVSVVAALAVAVGGGLLGSTFAAHTTNQVPSGTEQVPVIAPVSLGQPPSEANPTGSADSNSASRVVAEREVRLLATDPASIDPELLDLIATLTESPDPETELIFLGRYGDDPENGASGGDDPCAPRDDSDPEDCPDGYHSTVLPMVAMPEFVLTGTAFPQTGEDYRNNPDSSSAWCDGPAPTDTSVPFNILSSVPGTFTVKYWPSRHPDRVQEVSGIETSLDDRQVFEEALLTADRIADVPLLQHCLTLDEVEPATAYTAVVTGIDINDRLGLPSTVRFNSAGNPSHPGARIIPLGENLVYVSALHPTDQHVEIRAVARTPEAIPTCSDIDSHMSLLTLTDTHTDANPESLIIENAPPSFTQKHAVTFAVPEGSTVVVCARWYQDDSSPSWELVQPLFESSAVVQAPDRLDPRVELTQADSLSPLLESVWGSVSTTRGNWCGSARWSATDGGASLPLVLCKSIGDTGDARGDSRRGFFGDRGASSDLVLRFDSAFRDSTTTTATALIPGADNGCRGICALPEDAFYTVHLLTVEGEYAGRTVVKVSWEQGDQNGQSDWNLTPTSDIAPDYDVPDEAQFDKNERWSLTEPHYEDRDGARLPVTFVTGSFTLTVDRPVDYTVRLLEGTAQTQAERCDSPGEPLMTSGHTSDSVELSLPGLCLGSTYFPEIELVDADGRSTLWSLQDRVHFLGAQGMFTVPGIPATVTIDFEANSSDETIGKESSLRYRDIMVGTSGFLTNVNPVGACLNTAGVSGSETKDVLLGSKVRLAVGARVQFFGWGNPENCRGFNGESHSNLAQVVVPIDELFSSDGVTLDSRDGTLRLTLTVGATHPPRL